MRALSTLRVRLILVMAAVVAVAIGVVFLYVVPTLHDSLISQRFDRLQKVATTERRSRTLQKFLAADNNAGIQPILKRIRRLANANVDVYHLDASGRPVPVAAFPAVQPGNAAVRRAADGTPIVRGRGEDGDLVVAVRMPNSDAVIALSQQVSDVNATADTVERRILIAAVLALAVASAVGWGAAHAVSRRLARLERAATRISMGEFGEPIGDPSPDELGELSRAFDTMQVRLEQSDRARKDFIANASHELRTPLFTLGGFLELVDDEDMDVDTRREFLREMRDQVTRLTKLASDLLDLSRLDAGAFDVAREPVDLGSTARGLVREFRGLAAGHGSRVALVRAEGEMPHAIADEQRVRQIGRALVDNAIRHNPRGTEVRVAVGAQDGVVRLTVGDDGPGIDAATAAHMFERFYRGETASAAGSGLGLAIARELAERMGGSLELRSRDGETAFALSLPAEPMPEPVLA